MKQTLKIVCATLCTALLIQGCAPSSQEETNTETENVTDGNITVKFIELNDLHAHLTPHLQEVHSNDGKTTLATRGGIARIAAKIDELKDANTIVMNVGDTYHGGAEALFSAGNDIVEIVNQLPIDIAVPGNWDYAYGPLVTNARFANAKNSQVKRPNFKHLAANIKFKDPDNADTYLKKQAIRTVLAYQPGENFLSPTTMIDKHGIHIGIIGISSDIVKRMHPMLALNLDILQGEQNYKNLINTLSAKLRKDGANMVVVMSELGIHKDKRLADIIDPKSVDVFFSAHTHEATFKMLDSISGAKVVESGNDTYLGEMNAIFENKNLKELQWTLHQITQDIQPKESILALVNTIRAPYLKTNPNITAPTILPDNIPASLASLFFPEQISPTLHQSLNKKLTAIPFTLTRKQALQSSYNNAFSDMLRSYTGTDVAMTSGFRFAPPLANSNPNSELYDIEDNTIVNEYINVEDAYRFLPLTSIMSKADIKVKDFKKVIEENLQNVFSTDVFKQNGGWIDGYSGIELNLNLKNTDGHRISSISFKHLNKDDNDLISVTGCSRPFETKEGVLCGYSGFSNVQNIINPETNKAFLNNEFMIYALENELLDSVMPREDIHDVSETLMWPKSNFVQPLEGAK